MSPAPTPPLLTVTARFLLITVVYRARIVLALTVAIVAWGLWAVFNKLGARSIDPIVCQAIACATSAALVPILLYASRGRTAHVTSSGIAWLVAGQVCALTATLAFYFALKTRGAAQSTGISSLYLVVACILSTVFLREPMSTLKVIGMLLIVAGSWALATG